MRSHPIFGAFVATSVALAASSCDGSSSSDSAENAAPPTSDANGPGQFTTGASGGGGNGEGGPCRNLQCQQVDCTRKGMPSDATTVSGTVYDPAGLNPVYNAIVYIPNDRVKPFASGVVCDKCGVLTTGNPVVSALTDANGRFELRNAPAGSDVPLVIQIGKWRRQTTIASITSCADNPIMDRNLTRLPANQHEGDMPQIALATGGCDAFECLLRKIGIADGEFTSAGGAGRVHVYRGLNGMGMFQSTAAIDLWSDAARMKTYDVIINSCECAEHAEEKTPAMVQNHEDYANAGGRVFDTHYNYYWVNHDPGPLASTAAFAPDTPGPDSTTATIDTSFPKGDAFATWLLATGASTTKGQIGITQAKYDVPAVHPPSTRWVYGSSSRGPNVFHYTFNTPVGAPDDQQCGKVLFSDFHAGAGSNVQQVPFPAECNENPMDSQEAALEFMLFDLSSCVQIETEPPARPK